MSATNNKPGWCDTMERPKEACGCPDCGSSLIDIGGMRNTPPADAMPTLPRTLLSLLGEYGMARSDGVSQVEVTHRWLLVIAGIKRYAAEIAAPKDAEIARLSAALSVSLAQLEEERARNAAAWRPMDTAPKDGTEVLLDLTLDKSRARRAVIGHYMEGGHCIEDHPAIDRGWYFWTGRLFDKAPDPAGWMPLPPPLAIIPGEKS